MVSSSPEPGKVKLLDRVREAMRFKHYSLRTERTYIDWIKRFIIYHGKRHPETMGADEVRRFLNNLASERRRSQRSEIRSQRAARQKRPSNIEWIKVKDALTIGGHPTKWQF